MRNMQNDVDRPNRCGGGARQIQRSHHFALAKLGQPVNNSSMPIRSIQSIVFLGFCVGCVLLSVLKPIAVAETTMQTFANADRYVGFLFKRQ